MTDGMRKIVDTLRLLDDEKQSQIISMILHDKLAESNGESICVIHLEEGKQCPLAFVAVHGAEIFNLLSAHYKLMLLNGKNDPAIAQAFRRLMSSNKPFITTVRQVIAEQLASTNKVKGAVLENPETQDSKEVLFLAHLSDRPTEIDEIVSLKDFLKQVSVNLFNHESRNTQQPNDDSEPPAKQPDRTRRSGNREADDPAVVDYNNRFKRRASDRPKHDPISRTRPEVPDRAPPSPRDQPDGRSEESRDENTGTENDNPTEKQKPDSRPGSSTPGDDTF